MSGVNLRRLCEYDPSRDVSYYTERLAAFMRFVASKRGESTHAYTKEIRRALEALVYSAWDKSNDFLRDIARSQVPDELRASELRECYALLLEGLLRRFREISADLPIGSRILLMNMILSSIAEMARYSLPPGGEKFLNYVFSSISKKKREGGENP